MVWDHLPEIVFHQAPFFGDFKYLARREGRDSLKGIFRQGSSPGTPKELGFTTPIRPKEFKKRVREPKILSIGYF